MSELWGERGTESHVAALVSVVPDGGIFASGEPASSMSCPVCGEPSVAFDVPSDLREYAPEETERAGICTVCLRTFPVDDPPASFRDIVDAFPEGDGGVALALALGKLDSLALKRTAIVALCERAERAGVDPLLAVDRLAAAGNVEPHFDVDRRRHQLAQVLE